MSAISYNLLKGFIAIISCGICLASYGQVKVTAKMDSTVVLMGKQTSISLETMLPEASVAKMHIDLPSDTLVKDVEIVEMRRVDSLTSNGITKLRHEIVIQSFDSGLYALPPIAVVVGGDTNLTNHLILKVIPVKVDSLQGKIHDYEGVADPGRNFLDFIPQSIYQYLLFSLIAAIIIAATIYVYLRYIKDKKKLSKETVILQPPYDEAIKALEILKSEKLCERGQEKEFYTRLTDILRRYLDRRFDIKAMEMTSTEILEALKSDKCTAYTQKQMSEILSMADFVKFAKVRPLPQDNQTTFANAMNFIEATKPIEEDKVDVEPSKTSQP